MEEGYKQALIDAVLANRGAVAAPQGLSTSVNASQIEQLSKNIRVDDNLISELNSLTNKDISNSQFIAQLITTLEVFDAKVSNQNNQSFDVFYADNKAIVEDSLIAVEPFIEGEATFANQYNSYSFTGPRYMYALPVDFVDEVNKGIDMATGISNINEQEATEYRKFLQEQVEEFVDETGKVAVIAKPKGGSGMLFYTSPSIEEQFTKNGTDNISLRYNLPSLKTFGANDAEVYYYPKMEQPSDSNSYIPSGEYVTLKKNIDADGQMTADPTTGGEYLTFDINKVTGKFENFKRETFTSDEYNNYSSGGGQPIELIGNTEAEIQESFDNYKSTLLQEQVTDEFTNTFGNLPADHFIFQNTEAEYQEPTVEGFVQDTKEQFTAAEYGVDNLYGGFDHISGDPVDGKISWISLPPDEQQAIQLQLMQAGFLSPDSYYTELGTWGSSTQGAMKTAMTEANYKLQKIGPYLQSTIEDYKNRPIIYPQVYPSAGPLAVKNAVQTAIDAAGGRTNMTTGEMAAFMDFYKDSEADYSKAATDYTRNLELVNRRMFPDSKLTVPDSPTARTADFIEQTLEPEIISANRAQEEKRNVSYLTYSTDRMRDIIG